MKTEQEIREKLGPGRELDALVAERVMNIGWKVFPRYSTDIGAAVAIVERMYELGWDGDLEWYRSIPGLPDGTRMYRSRFARIERQQDCAIEFAESVCVAICHAALSALELTK